MADILLVNLPSDEQAHWRLHLNAVMKDSPTLKGEVRELLMTSYLPVKHPAYIHDWLEKPELRDMLEVIDG